MKIAWVILGIALLGTLVSYGLPKGVPATRSVASASLAVSSAASASTTPDVANAPARAARKDLANRLSKTDADIEIVQVTDRTWNDSCMGLPKPGEGCAQMTIAGYEIRLRADGTNYFYRTDTTGTAFRLEPR